MLRHKPITFCELFNLFYSCYFGLDLNTNLMRCPLGLPFRY